MEELLLRKLDPEVLWVLKKDRAKREDTLEHRCRIAGWKIEARDRRELDAVSEGLNHQGYVAFIREFPYLTQDEFIFQMSQLEDPLVIALDQLQDVGNLGAILRSAECAGANGAILPEHRSASVTAAVIRRSAGAALYLPICREPNLARVLDSLKGSGFRVIGADQEGARSLFRTDLTGRVALVIGSEGRGLRPGIKRRCDGLAAIPLSGRISSLNASAAAAVCLFEATRQRIEAASR